jgi:hypothetical protein
MIAQRTHALGDDAIEAPDLRDHRVGHSLTLVSKSRMVNR